MESLPRDILKLIAPGAMTYALAAASHRLHMALGRPCWRPEYGAIAAENAAWLEWIEGGVGVSSLTINDSTLVAAARLGPAAARLIAEIYPHLDRGVACIAAAGAGDLAKMLALHEAGFPFDTSAVVTAVTSGHGHFIDWVLTLPSDDQIFLISDDVIAEMYHIPDKIPAVLATGDQYLLILRQDGYKRLSIRAITTGDEALFELTRTAFPGFTISVVLSEPVVVAWSAALARGDEYSPKILAAFNRPTMFTTAVKLGLINVMAAMADITSCLGINSVSAPTLDWLRDHNIAGAYVCGVDVIAVDVPMPGMMNILSYASHMPGCLPLIYRVTNDIMTEDIADTLMFNGRLDVLMWIVERFPAAIDNIMLHIPYMQQCSFEMLKFLTVRLSQGPTKMQISTLLWRTALQLGPEAIQLMIDRGYKINLDKAGKSGVYISRLSCETLRYLRDHGVTAQDLIALPQGHDDIGFGYLRELYPEDIDIFIAGWSGFAMHDRYLHGWRDASTPT